MTSLASQVAHGQDTVVTATIALGKVSTSHITTNDALISWVTTMESTSEVRYDAGAHPVYEEYANVSSLRTSLVMSHSVILTGLAPAHTYHFRVRSTAGYLTLVSDDFVFTTAAGVVGGTGGIGGGGNRGRSVGVQKRG